MSEHGRATGRARVQAALPPLPPPAPANPATLSRIANHGSGTLNAAGHDVVNNHVQHRNIQHHHVENHHVQNYAPDYYEHARRFSPLAIAAFVLALMFWPAALPVGYAARSRIRRTGEHGGALATASIVIGWSMLALTTIFVVLFIALFNTKSDDLAMPSGPTAKTMAKQVTVRITSGPAWPEFTPVSHHLGVGSTVTWVNKSNGECRLIATHDELPDGKGANPIPRGGSYAIKFTETGLFGFACDGEFASGGSIMIS